MVTAPNHCSLRPRSAAPQKAATLKAPVRAVVETTWNVISDSMSPSRTMIPPAAAELKATTMTMAMRRRRTRTARPGCRRVGVCDGAIESVLCERGSDQHRQYVIDPPTSHRFSPRGRDRLSPWAVTPGPRSRRRSEEHTSELQSRGHLVCRLLLEKKNHADNFSLASKQNSLFALTADPGPASTV